MFFCPAGSGIACIGTFSYCSIIILSYHLCLYLDILLSALVSHLPPSLLSLLFSFILILKSPERQWIVLASCDLPRQLFRDCSNCCWGVFIKRFPSIPSTVNFYHKLLSAIKDKLKLELKYIKRSIGRSCR